MPWVHAICDATDYVCTTGDEMTGRLTVDVGTDLGVVAISSMTGEFNGTVHVTQSTTTDFASNALFAQNQATGTGNKYAIYGRAIDASGTNYGVRGVGKNSTTSYGILGESEDSTTGYGVYGTATGSGTTNYGVYGPASGGTTNWAGYFDGDARVTSDLIVDGNVEIDNASDYTYSAAKTYYRNAPAVTCVPFRDDWPTSIIRIVSGGYAYIGSIVTYSYHAMFCPIHLPEGAQVTELSCTLYDNDSSGYAKGELVRTDLAGGYNYMATVSTSSESTSVQTVATTTIYYASISNSDHNYFVRFWLDPSAAGTGYIRAYNCRLKYLVTTVAP